MPDTIKIVDNGKDGEDTFFGSSTAVPIDQQAYGSSNGTEFDGAPVQPLAALPGVENPDDQIMAIGIGEPTHTIGYGFTYEPVPSETVSFNYKEYDSSPSYEHSALYVEGQEHESSSASGGDTSGSGEESSEPSTTSKTSGTSGASNPSKSSGASGGHGTSGASGGHETSGASGGSGASGTSGASCPPCFTRGTVIRTARGEVLVEELVIGDLLWTEAHGLQPIRWTYQREVNAGGDFAPIKISKGTLGADRDILVSPAHRMLMQGPDVEVLFGVPKALVAAKDLVNGRTITRETTLRNGGIFPYPV